jgi:hypothetical protein
MSGIIGLISVSAAVPGASAVKSLFYRSEGDSTTRHTIVTPTSGKKLRILSATCATATTTDVNVGIYFGTGADFPTNTASIVSVWRVDNQIENNAGDFWPDGAGPVGAVDAVLSIVTGENITAELRLCIQYREE